MASEHFVWKNDQAAARDKAERFLADLKVKFGKTLVDPHLWTDPVGRRFTVEWKVKAA